MSTIRIKLESWVLTTVVWEWHGMMMAHEERDWIFVSDAHFTGNEYGEMESFLKFLDVEKERMRNLVILGDLFEFFFGRLFTLKQYAFCLT